MTRYFKDIKSNKYFTTDELGRNEYQLVSHEMFPTLRSFLEFVSVENGGTLQEVDYFEYFYDKHGMTESEYEELRIARIENAIKDFVNSMNELNRNQAKRFRDEGKFESAEKMEKMYIGL